MKRKRDDSVGESNMCADFVAFFVHKYQQCIVMHDNIATIVFS